MNLQQELAQGQLDQKYKWSGESISVDGVNINLSETKAGENTKNWINKFSTLTKNSSNDAMTTILSSIENDMKYIISQSNIQPVVKGLFTNKDERCKIPLFKYGAGKDSDSAKLGLSHEDNDNKKDYKLNNFMTLVKKNPKHVLDTLKNILVKHLEDKNINSIDIINSYTSGYMSANQDAPINWNKSCNTQLDPRKETKTSEVYDKIRKNRVVQQIKNKELLKKNVNKLLSKSQNNNIDNIETSLFEEKKKNIKSNPNVFNFNEKSDVKTAESFNDSKSNEVINTETTKRNGQGNKSGNDSNSEINLTTVLGGSIYKEYSKKIRSAKSLNQIKKIGGELKELMTNGSVEHDKDFTKLIKQLGGKRDELAKKK